MRWKQKSKRKIVTGDRRIRGVFLLFPMLLEREWRWLEMATIEEEAYLANRPIHGSRGTFQMIAWAERRWRDDMPMQWRHIMFLGDER